MRLGGINGAKLASCVTALPLGVTRGLVSWWVRRALSNIPFFRKKNRSKTVDQSLCLSVSSVVLCALASGRLRASDVTSQPVFRAPRIPPGTRDFQIMKTSPCQAHKKAPLWEGWAWFPSGDHTPSPTHGDCGGFILCLQVPW